VLAENIRVRGIVSYLRITGHLGTCRTGSLEKEIRLLESNTSGGERICLFFHLK
jgi:hypothetical protein